jgi:hypothetical protein
MQIVETQDLVPSCHPAILETVDLQPTCHA